MKLRYLFTSLAALAALAVGCTQELPGDLAEIKVESSFISLPAEGGSATTVVSASSEWAFQELDSKAAAWLTVSPLSGGAGETTVTFSAEEASATREAALKILVGGKTQYINVKQTVVSEGASLSTCAEVLAGADGKTYQIEGAVTRIAESATYGNWYINDGTGEVYIYGTKYNGQTKQAALIKYGIEVGDVVKIEGPKTTYNGTVELVDVDVLNITKSLLKIESIEPANAPKDGGKVDVKLTYKGDKLAYEINDEWISVAGQKVDGDTTIVSLKIDANNGGAREGSITFSSAKGGQESVVSATIKQEGAIAEVSIADFLAAPVDANAQYKLTGLVTSIAKAEYGNIYIRDWSGEAYVYGVGAKGEFETLGVEVGDIITVIGTRGEYKGDPQMAGGQYDSHIDVTEVSIAEFNAAEKSKDVYYRVTGTITEVAKADYGNLYITDGTDNLYVYGVYPGWGATGDNRKNFLATAGIEVGDVLTVAGYKDVYNDVIELCGGVYVSHEKGNVKAFSVSPVSINVESAATEASFDVTADVAWTVTCPEGVTATPASGDGNATVALAFAANTAASEIKYEVKVSTESTEVVTKEYTVTLTQAGTVETVYANCGELNAAILAGVTDFKANFETAAEITVLGSDNKSIFVQDATGAILIYSGDIYTALTGKGGMAGLGIKGEFSGTATLYNGLPEITAVDITKAETPWVGGYPCKNLTLSELVTNYTKYLNMKVKIDNVEVIDGWSASDKNGKVSQDSKELAIYVKNTGISDVATVGQKGNICGFVNVYNGTPQINCWENGKWVATYTPDPGEGGEGDDDDANTITLKMSDYFTENTNVASTEGSTFTFGDFQFTFTKFNQTSVSNYNASDAGIRFYQNDTMKIDAGSQTMTKIEFTFYGGKQGPLSADKGAVDGATWTGEASNVTFTATAQARFSEVKITLK